MAKIHSFPPNERTEAWGRSRAQVLASSESFAVRPKAPGVAELSFGPLSVNVTLDALHDLTYELAAFVARCEEDGDYLAAITGEGASASPSPRSNAKNTSSSSSDDA